MPGMLTFLFYKLVIVTHFYSEQLQLAPDHCVNDVILACTINAGHFFLQQPTHPTYPQLNQLDYLMKLHYSEGSAPPLPDIYPGLLCAAPTEEGWYRAMVKFVNQSKTQCDIMFVDYGGYAFNVPVSALRPIRSDFVVLPFQASECFLSNVAPVNRKSILYQNVFKLICTLIFFS